MWKKTQIKDAIRNIGKQKVSFLSIVVIAFIGVTAYLGIFYSAQALRRNGSAFYNRVGYRDMEVVSSLLFSEQDREDLRMVEGVQDVEAVWQADARVSAGDAYAHVTAISLTERVNRPELKEGRLPQKASECLIEGMLAEKMGWQVGDEVELSALGTLSAAYLKGGTYLVTGIADHPDHANRIVTQTLYVMVTPEAFDQELLGGCFMKAEIVTEKQTEPNRFSDSYADSVKAVARRVEELGVTSAQRRDQEAREEFRVRLEAEEAKLSEAEAELIDGRARLEDGWKQLEEGEEELARALKQQETATPLIAQAMQAAIDEGKAKIEAGRKTLEEGEATYQAGLLEYEEGKRQLEKLREEIGGLDPCRWIIADAKGNVSLVQLSFGSESLENMKGTFALMFMLIGALVIFATVSKMVDEQRSLVGAAKALGLWNREIFAKYLAFGCLATAIGTTLGVLAARFPLERYILNSYDNYYVFDITSPYLAWGATAIVFFAGLGLSAAAVYLACRKLLRESVVSLMNPRVPVGVKKRSRSEADRRSLYSRLIMQNMRTDLKRVVVTTVSVAGCCTLIVSGFTFRHALNGAFEGQSQRIMEYDARIRFDAEKDGASESIRRIVEEAGGECAKLFVGTVTYQINEFQMADFWCGDLGEISQFFHLYDWKKGTLLAVQEETKLSAEPGAESRPADLDGESTPSCLREGILIQRRMAEIYDLSVGDELEIALGGTKTARVRVAGIFENYIGRQILMSQEAFRQAFGETQAANAILTRGLIAGEGSWEKQLREVPGFEEIVFAQEDFAVFESATGVLHTLVILFILMAVLMAGVVQMNLTNLYVQQKKQELTVMRINGFTVREVILYMIRETVVITAVGTLSGVAIGSNVAYHIVRIMEQPFIRFERSVSPAAWGIGIVTTILFTVIVNVIALRPVRTLKLTEVDR